MDIELPPHGVELIRKALAWQRYITERDFDAIWDLMHPMFKTVVAQSWVMNNPELLDSEELLGWSRDDVVNQVCEDLFRIPHGGGLQSMVLRELGRVGADEFGVSQSVRVLGPNLEAVLLVDQSNLPVDVNGTSYIPGDGGSAVVSPVFFSSAGSDVLVSGFGQYFEPGWPPALVDVDLDSY